VVFGPVLARALARLALTLLSLVTFKSLLSFSGRSLDDFKLGILDLLHGPSQCLAEDGATPIDLAQAGVAAALGDGG
jgi:hypothetical protein